ncbi:MAG: transcriptional regulator [Bacteroidetes bacterium]|nr:transcriptional regulator [Bacteroidota bacterium]
MPQTKKYTERRKILNQLFRSRYYTLDELIERVREHISDSVSKKTIQDMIKYMRAEGAPIKNVRGRGYIYEPKGYNIEDVKVTSSSVEKIKLAASILKQVPGLDIHEELNEVFKKLDMRDEMEHDETIIQFDTRPNYEGAKFMVDILEATKGRTVISFDYQPFKYDSPKNVVVHPYLLKEYNNRWFLLGLPEELRKKQRYEFQQFALERIKSKIKAEAKIEHYQHHDFDPVELYKNIYGMSTPQGAEVERVVLGFSPMRAKYVATNPLHHTQQMAKNAENTFEFHLIPNNELEGLILSYGKDVEVLEPKNLRTKIAALITAAGKHYL